MIATALSIAGSDPSGGAGIQADLKTFSARGVYGMTALTALTAQNTCGVTAIEWLSPDFVKAQIHAVFEDVRVGAIKVGMIANAQIAVAVAQSLQKHAGKIPVVVDPVMVAKGGARLLEKDAVEAMIQTLIPCARLLTPNLPEAAALLGCTVATDRSQMEEQAAILMTMGPEAILLKGGHLSGHESPDLLATQGDLHWLESARVDTTNTHGTGCTLSAAVAAELSKGRSMHQAVVTAKSYLQGALKHADSLQIGQGHGPTHHFFELWNT